MFFNFLQKVLTNVLIVASDEIVLLLYGDFALKEIKYALHHLEKK